MKRLYNWFKTTSTHKCITTFVYIACGIFTIVVIIGWFRGLENAVGMMNCVAMVVLGNSIQYSGKAGFEHSQWANPIFSGAISGLVSGDPASGISNALASIQMAEQSMPQDAENYADPSSAPPPENMPADDLQISGQTPQ